MNSIPPGGLRPSSNFTPSRIAGHKRRTDRWPTSLLLSIYFIGRTIMAGPSGLPQFADVGLAATMLRLRVSDLNWLSTRFLPLMAFTSWVLLVDLTWATFRTSAEYLLFAAYYVFNLLSFVLFARTWVKDTDRMRRYINRGACAAVLLQVGSIMFGAEFRAEGTFNNPNQLAYFGICALAAYLISRDTRKRVTLDVIITALVVWIELKSLSRAGIVAGCVLLVSLLFELLQTARARVGIGIAAVAIIGFLVVPGAGSVFGENSVLAGLEYRLTSRMSAYEELEARNAARISQYTHYTLIGAGEGDVERFAGEIEIHSTFGTLLFSYGVVGVSLFVLFLLQLVRRLPASHYVYLLAILLYSLTHNGLRFTYAWALLGVLAGVGELRSMAARRPSRATTTARIASPPDIWDPTTDARPPI